MADNPNLPKTKGLMIAAPHSGSGKTLITLALLRALKQAGHNIRAAKAGPDYIDPAFHEVSSGQSSLNLDPWAMSPERCRQLTGAQGRGQESGQDFLLVESMMGLYDGASDGTGSGADLAKNLNMPVILVVDAAKQSHSIAALVRGFRDHDPSINICGVILNRVGSQRHESMLRQALDEINIDVLGAVLRNPELQIPERHLGLVQAGEILSIEKLISFAAIQIEDQCDLEKIIRCFQPIQGAGTKFAEVSNEAISPPGQNIAIARDQAFSFIYPHLVNDWQQQGAQISYFSPLADEGPALDADAVFLPGGYPELHAGKLTNCDQFFAQMENARSRGSLIYGECGGYMVLGDGITDKNGIRHGMLGFLGLETSFERRKLHLGYRIVEPCKPFFGCRSINAHEFHYTSATKQKGEPLFKVKDASGNQLEDQGLRRENVLGSYIHLINGRTAQ